MTQRAKRKSRTLTSVRTRLEAAEKKSCTLHAEESHFRTDVSGVQGRVLRNESPPTKAGLVGEVVFVQPPIVDSSKEIEFEGRGNGKNC
jgi:hypothetical protein